MINKIPTGFTPQFKGNLQGERTLKRFSNEINSFIEGVKALPSEDTVKIDFKTHKEGPPIELQLEYQPGQESQQKKKVNHLFFSDFDGMKDFLNRSGQELHSFLKDITKS